MLDLEHTIDYFGRHFTRTAFRLEALDRYDVESDGKEFDRYLSGADPEPGFKEAWLDVLRNEKAAGKVRQRVHILRRPLTDYLRYECEWGYVPNAHAGEQIRILDLTGATWPEGIPNAEFWILDETNVLLMIYDGEGRFLGAEIAADAEPYRRGRDLAIAASEDFLTWWNRHTVEWRRNRAA